MFDIFKRQPIQVFFEEPTPPGGGGQEPPAKPPNEESITIEDKEAGKKVTIAKEGFDILQKHIQSNIIQELEKRGSLLVGDKKKDYDTYLATLDDKDDDKDDDKEPDKSKKKTSKSKADDEITTEYEKQIQARDKKLKELEKQSLEQKVKLDALMANEQSKKVREQITKQLPKDVPNYNVKALDDILNIIESNFTTHEGELALKDVNGKAKFTDATGLNLEPISPFLKDWFNQRPHYIQVSNPPTKTPEIHTQSFLSKTADGKELEGALANIANSRKKKIDLTK